MFNFSQKLYDDFVSGAVCFSVDKYSINEIQRWLDSFGCGHIGCRCRGDYHNSDIAIVGSDTAFPDWPEGSIGSSIGSAECSRFAIIPWDKKDAMLNDLCYLGITTILEEFVVSRRSFINIMSMGQDTSGITAFMECFLESKGVDAGGDGMTVSQYIEDCRGDVYTNLFMDCDNILNACTEAGVCGCGDYKQDILFPLGYLAIKLTCGCEDDSTYTDDDFDEVF